MKMILMGRFHMNYLFWNVNKNKNIDEYLKNIIIENQCDVVILAEYENDIYALARLLNENNYNLYPIKQIGCEKIHILTNSIPEKVQRLQDSSRYTINSIPHENLIRLNIAAVHLSSKLNSENERRAMELRTIKNKLEAIEDRLENTYSIIVGDFNMNPFESPMVSADNIHSLSSGEISKKTRTIDGEEYRRFYNPMWNLLGDRRKPEGSYYYNSSDPTNYYWNIFDQVIIRPELIEYFHMDSLSIVDSINGESLLKQSGIPDKEKFSDHLPIYFKIC